MDTATSDIRAGEFTPSSEGDSPVLPELLDQIPEGEEIGTVTADGAYDTRRCHTTIIDRQATAIIPIRKNGRPDHALCGPLMGLMDTAARVGFEGTFTAADIFGQTEAGSGSCAQPSDRIGV